MKLTIQDSVRTFIMGPEMLAIAVVALFAEFLPQIAVLIGTKIQEGQFAVTSSVIGAPVALTVGTWYLTRDLLRPSDEHRKTLVEWPEYWRLTLRAQCALLWTLVGVASASIGLVLVFALHPRIGAAAILSGVLVAAIATVTVALANLVVRDILDGARPGG